MTSTTRRDDREALAREFATLKLKIAPVEVRIEEIKADLKTIAEATGNFREVVDGKGTVDVSGPKDGDFKGIFPVVDERAFLSLPEDESKRLLKSGIIKMEPRFGSKFYGRVGFEPFRTAATKAA